VITGHATETGTAGLTERRPELAYGRLGRIGLTVSQAGFGGYRIASGVDHHRRALEAALTAGINLIDTSANYADGGSETLVGEVVAGLVDTGRLNREALVVVSKVGYLQGRNFTLSQQREAEGRPFPELVPYDKALAHCIHPEFLDDQLTRSLARLQLDTLDVYLLHNPEYYLGWAAKAGMDLEAARTEYYRRIEAAFRHLETEVDRGRIRCYGVSSNTFPAPAAAEDFTSLERIWQIAADIRDDHHLAVVQLPMNLLEPGALLEANQSEGRSALNLARRGDLAVLVNRPLNAFTGNRLLRLAEVATIERQDTNTIIAKIRSLGRMEKRLWHGLLPRMPVPSGIVARIKEQLAIGDLLKHYWQNFGDYEYWRHVHTNVIGPRVQGVVDYLAPLAKDDPGLAEWLPAHRQALDKACASVASMYGEKAALEVQRLRRTVAAADADWAQADTLSQKAVRALRSTSGVTSVLVGMRREAYVTDVLAELCRPVTVDDRLSSWQALQHRLRPSE
jgi:aryl-alcohol dehydrogenase-like predicted oxidoreductase